MRVSVILGCSYAAAVVLASALPIDAVPAKNPDLSPVAMTLRAGQARLRIGGDRIPAQVNQALGMFGIESRDPDDWLGYYHFRAKRIWKAQGTVPAMRPNPAGKRYRHETIGSGEAHRRYAVYFVQGRRSYLLQSGTTDRAGYGADGSFTLPRGVTPGRWALQYVSSDELGRKVVASAGVRVLPPWIKRQRPVDFSWELPIYIPYRGYTRVSRLPVVTNAGQGVQVRVTCRRTRAGSVDSDGFCQVVRKRHAVGVRLFGVGPGTVTVRLHAPRVPGFTGYTKVKEYTLHTV